MFEITAALSSTILIIIFLISMVILIKGADYLLEGAERIGKFLKMPAFVIGALIVGIGTSLPELASSVFSALGGNTEIVSANVVGSNIANILLVAGLASIIGGVIYTTKELAKLEIPLLVISTSLFIFVAFDGLITFYESLIVFLAFIVYITYLLNHQKFSLADDKKEAEEMQKKEPRDEIVKSIGLREFSMLIFGGVGLAFGANYLIESVVALSDKWDISKDIISMSAIAIGTSLPEIVVSSKAVLRGKTDLAFGNVFGSNVFNMLMITGVIGIFTNIELAETTLYLALPMLAVTTLIFYVSATAKRIYIWEGLMFVLFYILFSLKIFGLI